MKNNEIHLKLLSGDLISTVNYSVSGNNGHLLLNYTYEDKLFMFPIKFGTQYIPLSKLSKLISIEWVCLNEYNTQEDCDYCDCSNCSCNGCDGNCNQCDDTRCNPCKGCNGCMSDSYSSALHISVSSQFLKHYEIELSFIGDIIMPHKQNAIQAYNEYLNYIEKYRPYSDLILLYSSNINDSEKLTDLSEKRSYLAEIMNFRINKDNIVTKQINITSGKWSTSYIVPAESIEANSQGVLFWKKHFLITFTTYDYVSDEMCGFSREFPLNDNTTEKQMAEIVNRKKFNVLHLVIGNNGIWKCKIE